MVQRTARGVQFRPDQRGAGADRTARAGRGGARTGQRVDAHGLQRRDGACAPRGGSGPADRARHRARSDLPLAWIRRGWISAYLGDTQNALREFSTALYILPFEPITHIACIGVGCAHFGAERYDRAARWTREGVESHPGSFWGNRIAAAAAIHCGARDEARRIARSLLRKDPNLTVSAAGTALPFTPAINDRLSDGLRAAGVPLQ